MIPQYPEFKSFTIDDQDVLSDYLTQHPSSVCELNLANLVAFQDIDRPKVTRINDNLCILLDPVNEPPFFLSPIGTHDSTETLKTCLEKADAVSRVPKEALEQIRPDGFTITPLRDHFDYLYLVKDLADLKGKRYDSKRNHIRKLIQAYPDRNFIRLTKTDRDEALSVFDKWASRRVSNDDAEAPPSNEPPGFTYASQRQALERAFEFFDELRLLGGAIAVRNTLACFALGSRLNTSTVALHFLYCDLEIPGVVPAVLSESCQTIFADFIHVNLEQDLGLPGLRKTKLSYHPIQLVEKYHIQKR